MSNQEPSKWAVEAAHQCFILRRSENLTERQLLQTFEQHISAQEQEAINQACAEKDAQITRLTQEGHDQFREQNECIRRLREEIELAVSQIESKDQEIERLKAQLDCRTGEAETYGRMLQGKDQEIERLKADLALATNAIHSMSSKHASESNRLTERLAAYEAILEHVFHIHQIGLVWEDCPRCAYEKLKGAQ